MYNSVGNTSSSNNSNRANVPEARAALDNMKFEIASELGINLKQGYNGDLPSRQAGYIGGYMVKDILPMRSILPIRKIEKTFSHRIINGRAGEARYRVRIII